MLFSGQIYVHSCPHGGEIRVGYTYLRLLILASHGPYSTHYHESRWPIRAVYQVLSAGFVFRFPALRKCMDLSLQIVFLLMYCEPRIEDEPLHPPPHHNTTPPCSAWIPPEDAASQQPSSRRSLCSILVSVQGSTNKCLVYLYV